MGIELAKIVAARLGSLSGPAYKVLIYMSLVALDQPNAKGQPARLYFAGRGPLALALGYETEVVDGEERLSPAAVTAVKRALRELRQRGLISDAQRARTGTRQAYRLNLSVSDLASWGSLTDPLWGTPSDPQQGVNPDPTGGRHVTPLGQIEDGSQDSPQDDITHPPASTTDRATEVTAMDDPHVHVATRAASRKAAS